MGLPVYDFVEILNYPSTKYLDTEEIVKAIMMNAAIRAGNHKFVNAKTWGSQSLVLLTLYRIDINIGLVKGYERVEKGRQKGRWKKIEGWATTLDQVHPESMAKKIFDKHEITEYSVFDTIKGQ